MKDESDRIRRWEMNEDIGYIYRKNKGTQILSDG